MGKETKKIRGQLNFTIHYMKVGSSTPNGFQIEWKRGDSRGFTDICFENDDQTVIYEKSFKCSATIYINKKTGEKKPKLLQLTVYIFHDGSKKKVYGKLAIDVAQTYGITMAQTKEYKIDSAHKKPTYISMSVIVSEMQEVDPNSDLTSVVEDRLETDKPDEWDVSAAVSLDDQKRIDEFFVKRREAKEKFSIQLSEFTKKPISQPRPSARNRMKAPSLISSGASPVGSLNTFLSQGGGSKSKLKSQKNHENNRSTPSFARVPKPDDDDDATPDSAPSLISTGSQNQIPLIAEDKDKSKKQKEEERKKQEEEEKKKQEEEKKKQEEEEKKKQEEEERKKEEEEKKKQEEEEKKEEEEEKDPIEQANEFLQPLIRYWMKSPADPSTIPRSAAALFASLVHAGVFSKRKFTFEEYQKIVDPFISRLSTRSTVEKGTQFDNLCVDFSLLKIVTSNDSIKEERRDHFKEKFIELVLRPTFSKYIDEITQDLRSAAQSIIMCTVDAMSAVTLIQTSIDNVIKKNFYTDQQINAAKEKGETLNVQIPFRDLIKETCINRFDYYFVVNILQNDFQVNFGNAANWNTIISIIREDNSLDLPLFREAISVLMTAQGLCQTPELVPDVSPHLTPDVVLKLMELEVPDELMPLPNETKAFAKFYNLQEFKPVDEVIPHLFNDYTGDFSEIIEDFPDEWESVEFDKETMSQFTFLEDYFANDESD